MTSKLTINLVVLIIGAFAIGALIGVFLLLDDGKPDTAVIALTTPMGVALGALASMLVSTRAGDVVAPAPPVADPVVAPDA